MGLVAQAGLSSFLEWFGGEQIRPAVTADVFGTAPRELTRSISLAQTLDLIRTVIAVVEREIADLAAPWARRTWRVRRCCATAVRSPSPLPRCTRRRPRHAAPGTRLESLVVDAVLRGGG